MSPRRYVARNHPAMPKAPNRGIRLCMDFPDVEAMMSFKETLNEAQDLKGPKLRCYKLDFFDIEEMPIGNHYRLSTASKQADSRTELTRKIIKIQQGE